MAWRFKLWRNVGAAAALAACGGEGGAPTGEGGEAGESGAVTHAPSLDMSVAPAGGEQGEAGADAAYAGLAGEQLIAQRLQHLKGFVLAAQTMPAVDAGILLQQGLLEAFGPAPDQFGALDIAPVRAAAAEASPRNLRAAAQAIDAAARGLDVDHAILAARMVDLATGLYQNVPQADFVDPIEYQHSRGAALAARDALAQGQGALRGANAHSFNEARAELDRFVALWPSVDPPLMRKCWPKARACAWRCRRFFDPGLAFSYNNASIARRRASPRPSPRGEGYTTPRAFFKPPHAAALGSATVRLNPSAFNTCSVVFRVGLPSALSARYRLSRESPVARATSPMPLERAIAPMASAITPASPSSNAACKSNTASSPLSM
jgi:hypothetical protein